MLNSADVIVRREIYQQPATWLTTQERAMNFRDRDRAVLQHPAVVTGAGTSAFAALAVAAAWPQARAVPSTDLLMDAGSFFSGRNCSLLSLARSGNSPESVAVIESLQRQRPEVRQLAITCNSEGRLAQAPGVETLLLDPRTNDQSLAMTSSFSNLVLAGLYLAQPDAISAALPKICRNVEASLSELDEQAQSIVRHGSERLCVLASRELYAAACEASLKTLEMTAGKTVTMAETFLGLRHGPMAFLRPDTLVLCFVSSDPKRARYEYDLVRELRLKNIGQTVAIAPDSAPHKLFHHVIPASAPDLPDTLRVPFEIVFAQLLAFHLSIRAGLNPDNPSPDNVINRVVQGVSIYET